MFDKDYCVNKTLHQCLMCHQEVVLDQYCLKKHLEVEHEGILMVGYFREFVVKEWKRKEKENVEEEKENNGQKLDQNEKITGQNEQKVSNSGQNRPKLKAKSASGKKAPKLVPVLTSEIGNNCVFKCKYCDFDTNMSNELMKHGKQHFSKGFQDFQGFMKQVRI